MLVALGHRIVAVNQSGHPDIVAIEGSGDIRVEVEAHLPRLPVSFGLADMRAILPRMEGYVALAVWGPMPRWYIMHDQALKGRAGLFDVTQYTNLSDPVLSAAWADQFFQIVIEARERPVLLTYPYLVQRALSG